MIVLFSEKNMYKLSKFFLFEKNIILLTPLADYHWQII